MNLMIGTGDMLSTHFSRLEFACPCGCGGDSVDAELLAALEVIRENFMVPVTITSAFRCFGHNVEVGGAAKSQHLAGRAADIVLVGVSPDDVALYAESLGLGGVGRYSTFTHIDTRSNGPARWG